jgi:Polysaccharide lyase
VGRTLLFEDACASSNYEALWGAFQAAEKSRVGLLEGGGGPWVRKGDGSPRTGTNARSVELRAADIANVGNRRTEVGENDSRKAVGMKYVAGKCYETWFEIELPSNFPVQTSWYVVMQMKQEQPFSNAEFGSPVLALQCRAMVGSPTTLEWQLVVQGSPTRDESNPLFRFTATRSRWTRFCFEVDYAGSIAEGATIRVLCDDRATPVGGLFEAQHDSGVMPRQTLSKAIGNQEAGSPPVTYTDGQPIPGHLRIGQYRDEAINPGGTGETVTTKFSNVQVYEVTEGNVSIQTFFPSVATNGTGMENINNIKAKDGVFSTARTGSAIVGGEGTAFGITGVIPETATIKKVIIGWGYKVDSTEGNAIFGEQIKIEPSTFVYDYGASEESPEPLTNTEFTKDITALRAWTPADFSTANFKYRFRARNNGGAETTFSLDALWVTVEWEEETVEGAHMEFGFVRDKARRLVVAKEGTGKFTQGFLRTTSGTTKGALCVAVNGTGKVDYGLVRDSQRRLCVVEDATIHHWNQGFPVDSSKRVIVTKSTTGAKMSQGFLRSPKGLLVCVGL